MNGIIAAFAIIGHKETSIVIGEEDEPMGAVTKSTKSSTILNQANDRTCPRNILLHFGRICDFLGCFSAIIFEYFLDSPRRRPESAPKQIGRVALLDFSKRFDFRLHESAIRQ